MKHVIRKQVISLQLFAEQEAFTIQQKAKEYFYDHIEPALERVLDELSSPGEIISLDRLEIDLGDLIWKNEKLADNGQLYRILKKSITDVLSSSEVKTNSSGPVKVATIQKHACQQWLYYMEYGVLPWALQQTPEAWLDKVLHQLAIDHVMIEKTKALMRNHRWFLARVVRDHKEQFLQLLAGVIAGKPQPDLVALINNILHQTTAWPQKYQYSKQTLWEEALMQFSEGKQAFEPGQAALRLPHANQQPELPNNAEPLVEEGIFCTYAGVLLLHPFFRHLFNHLALLEKGLFVNAAARQKAVMLLYYASTGNTEAKDHELVVAKTICGLPLMEVLEESAFVLTELEKEETRNMILAAIGQWPIIKNTSVEGLQEGFLQRNGKIFDEQNTILFRMETSGIDVLLDKLPWALSIIKFPWLNQLIRVEWR